MTPNPVLQQLKDIHLPNAIHSWPIAPGWIILYLLALALFSYCIYFCYQRRKQRFAIKHAIQHLNHLQTLIQHNPDNINIAAEISTLLRRTALHYFQRDTIAGLTGQAWLIFLNDSGRTTDFTAAAGELLIAAPYRKNNQADLEPLFAATEQWLTAIAKMNRKKGIQHV